MKSPNGNVNKTPCVIGWNHDQTVSCQARSKSFVLKILVKVKAFGLKWLSEIAIVLVWTIQNGRYKSNLDRKGYQQSLSLVEKKLRCAKKQLTCWLDFWKTSTLKQPLTWGSIDFGAFPRRTKTRAGHKSPLLTMLEVTRS